MILLSAMLLLSTASGGVPAPVADLDENIQLAQLIVRERVIIRVPAQAAKKKPAQMKWTEKKAPRCLPMSGVGGAAVVEEDSVDLILKGGKRVRARFESSCAALDYYSGFYILPTKDGQICADRDSIHTRSGGECQITRFRTLIPDR